MRQYMRSFLLLSATLLVVSTAFAQAPLDKTLKPDWQEKAPGEDVPHVFKDMGVVQRKAMNKSSKLLFSNYVGLDYSDGPYSMYSFNTDIGYALNDFFEVYFNFAPGFLTQKRSIVERVEAFELLNGDRATISMALPRMQYGVQILWAPLYGKDSLGTRKIIRSDTYFKAGFSMVKFTKGDGMKFHLGVGKTYFLGARTGFRITASGNYMETIVQEKKSFNPVMMLETGFVFYLL